MAPTRSGRWKKRPAATQPHLHYKVMLAASQEIIYMGK
jgi:hypothetical protein